MRVLLAFLLLTNVFAFSPAPISPMTSRYETILSAKSSTSPFNVDVSQAIRKGLCSLSGMAVLVPIAARATDELEYAELPPPYIPIIFAVALLAGVGLLTGSLGDVMEEESSLGLQSGARAKKEIERSRSSYFKKK